MALQIYNDGEHPAGYIGIRVAWNLDGQYVQRYFNFRTPDRKGFISRSEEKRLIEKAKAQEAKWRAQAAKIKYQRILNENHPNTLPFQGLGFTGITLMIRWDTDYRRLAHYPPTKADFTYFTPVLRVVCSARIGDQYFNINKLGLDGAWRGAVDCWATHFAVKPKDKQRILIEKRPSVDQFKQLRRHLNKQGWEIPLQVVNRIQ